MKYWSTYYLEPKACSSNSTVASEVPVPYKLIKLPAQGSRFSTVEDKVKPESDR